MAGQTEPPGPVALKFQHLLARITFAARSEGGNATVHSISLRGWMSGRLRQRQRNPLWSNTAEGTVSVEKETSVTPAGNADVSGDLLLIPQSLTDGVKLTVTYDTDAEGKDRFPTFACHHREHVGGGEPLPLLVHPHRRRLYRVRLAHGQRMERRHRRDVTIDVTQ